MYEAKQNKERVSRQVNVGGGARQRKKILIKPLQLAAFKYNRSRGKKVYYDSILESISNFKRNGQNPDFKEIGNDSGWLQTGNHQYVADIGKQEVRKCNHAYPAEKIKNGLISIYRGKMVKDVIEHNKLSTNLIGRNREKHEPNFDSNECKKKDVSDYIEEGMRLIIDYPKNIFIWPKTKGDSNHEEDDCPVIWSSDEVCKDKVDLEGWMPNGWQMKHPEIDNQLKIVNSNLSEAKRKLQTILSISLPKPDTLKGELTHMEKNIDEYSAETYLKTLYYYGEK